MRRVNPEVSAVLIGQPGSFTAPLTVWDSQCGHGNATYGWYYSTRPAKPAEYREELKKLRRCYAPEYLIVVCQRMNTTCKTSARIASITLSSSPPLYSASCGIPSAKRLSAHLFQPSKLKETGDFLSLSSVVCLAKEAARQIIEEGTLPAYRVHLSDGSNYVISMAAGITLEDARAYFIGKWFTQSDEITKLQALAVEPA